MIRVLTSGEYEKMTHWKTGRWSHVRVSPQDEEAKIKELQTQGETVKVYGMTTRVRGYYQTVILLRKTK